MSQNKRTARDHLVGLEYFVHKYERDIKGLLRVLAELGIDEAAARKRAEELLAPPAGCAAPFSGVPLMAASAGMPLAPGTATGGANGMPSLGAAMGMSPPSPPKPR